MNTGQMMLTIGAMLLLSLLILRVNNSFLASEEVMYDSKFGVVAVSLANSLITEAMGKAFDENTVDASVTSPNELSATLRLEPHETDPDDFDDYDDYTRIDSIYHSAVYTVSSQVVYVNPPNIETESQQRTFHKKITVTVTSPSMTDTITMSSVYSYWFFR